MALDECKYSLVVRAGIFQDGTYGIYAKPYANPKIEYQLRGQFDSALGA